MSILEHNKLYGEQFAIDATNKGARLILQLSATEGGIVFCSTGSFLDPDQVIKMLEDTAAKMKAQRAGTPLIIT